MISLLPGLIQRESSPALVPSGAQRLIVAPSDIEMGAGGITDAFPHNDFLADLILSYNKPPYDQLAVDLVFNGDTFDFLKTEVRGAFPTHITAAIALDKLARVADAHPRFFSAVQEFVSFGKPDRNVHFVVGNHDAELLFTDVQGEVRALCGGSERIRFPGLELSLGPVRIEHGSQGDEMFRMDPWNPWTSDRDPILKLPWGSLALLEVFVPLSPALYYVDRFRPRPLLLELLPELRELLLERSWAYWTRDFVRDVVHGSDPIKHLTFSMLKEIAYRFASVDTEVSNDRYYRNAVRRDRKHSLYILGHRHQAGCWDSAGKKVIITGCFRDESTLVDQGRKLDPIPKSYAEVFTSGDRVLRAQLVEVAGPPPPAGTVPKSVFDFRPVILELLGRGPRGHDSAWPVISGGTERTATPQEIDRRVHQ